MHTGSMPVESNCACRASRGSARADRDAQTPEGGPFAAAPRGYSSFAVAEPLGRRRVVEVGRIELPHAVPVRLGSGRHPETALDQAVVVEAVDVERAEPERA